MEQEISFSALLRRFRKAYHYNCTQAEIAEKFGYSEETIRSWELGRRFPAHDEIPRLARLMELDSEEIKQAIQIGRFHKCFRKENPSQNDLIKKAGTLPFSASLPIASPERTTSDYAAAFGLKQVQLITLIERWNKQSTSYYDLQQMMHQEIYMFEKIKQLINEEAYILSRRQTLIALAMLPVSSLLHSFQETQKSTLTPEELLPECAASLIACWHLMSGSQLATVEQALSAYLPTLEKLAQSYSKYQKAAASLATQGCMLQAILALHRLDFSTRTNYCNHAIKYSLIAEDGLLQAAALMYLGYNYGYINQPAKAIYPFQRALVCLGTTPSLLKNDVYMGMADAYARCGRVIDAQVSVGLAQDDFPAYPEHDPSFLFADCGLSALHIWQGRTFVDLSEHYPERSYAQKAWEALEQIHKIQPASERNRTEILICQAKAAFRLGDLELCCIYLSEGVKAASALNSRRRYDESLGIYQLAKMKWPKEQKIEGLQDMFVTFQVI